VVQLLPFVGQLPSDPDPPKFPIYFWLVHSTFGCGATKEGSQAETTQPG